MKTDPIKKILYGAWRPWIEEGIKNIRSEGTRWGSNDSEVNLYHDVRISAPRDDNSRLYARIIKQAWYEWYSSKLIEIEEQENSSDRRYLATSFAKEVETTLSNIPRIKAGLSDKLVKTKSTLSEYVLEVIMLHGVNLLLDLSLRSNDLTEEYSYSLPKVYFELLDQPPPEPSPFFKTVEWYKNRVYGILQKVTESGSVIAEAQEIHGQISDRLQSEDLDVTQKNILRQLFWHLENAVLLVKADASFLEDNTDQLLDGTYCRQWVQAMKRDLMFYSDPDEIIHTLKEMDEVAVWFIHHFEGPELVGDKLNVLQSEAKKWVREMMDFRGVELKEAGIRNRGRDSEAVPDNNDFMTFFNARFVHKKEIEAALNVDRKTLDGYLEQGEDEIRILRLKSNTWYYREDIETFLEEMTEV